MDMERLNEEFLNYQLLPAKDIPSSVKKSANLTDEDPHCTDILWGYLMKVKEPGTNDLAFSQLFRVAGSYLPYNIGMLERNEFSLL